MFFSASKFP